MQRLALTVIAILALYAYVYAETTCESHRRNSRASAHGMNWNIQCDSNGHYEPMQCTNDTEKKKWCTCYNKEEAITSPSRKTRTCDCPLARDAALNDNSVNDCDAPTCENTGKWKLKQCCGNMCHCANPHTGAKTSERQNNPNLQC